MSLYIYLTLFKAYLAAQDSASYAIQECLKVYGCSATSTNNAAKGKIENLKLWNSFPDYFKEILIPLRRSKYEIQSFDNLGSLKTPIILNECKNYEEWIYKWCAYLISKIETHYTTTSRNSVIDLTSNSPSSSSDQADKELKVIFTSNSTKKFLNLIRKLLKIFRFFQNFNS